jgi:hypothetical protein
MNNEEQPFMNDPGKCLRGASESLRSNAHLSGLAEGTRQKAGIRKNPARLGHAL